MKRHHQGEEDVDAMVPDEFSDNSHDDMEEFVEHEEQFEVRPSISSRGSIARANRQTNANYGAGNQQKGTVNYHINDPFNMIG